VNKSHNFSLKEYRYQRHSRFLLYQLLALALYAGLLVVEAYHLEKPKLRWVFYVFIAVTILRIIWGATAPYAIIKSGTITLRYTFFRSQTFFLKDVSTLTEEENVLHLQFDDARTVQIRVKDVHKDQQKDFSRTLSDLWEVERKTSS